ncbi:unnamed protein product [Schistocephalus solidus]|uniref:Uncharacterized protein n=1 Tax=Schistocephalus solidus TaxID=70667 RepID=A0A183TIR5_SCHSO|nr:unnamed protein product [Schistocephalus solidus]
MSRQRRSKVALVADAAAAAAVAAASPSDRQCVVRSSLPTLDNLDTFLRICNPDDSLQVLLMIEVGFDGFASLVMDYAVSKVESR